MPMDGPLHARTRGRCGLFEKFEVPVEPGGQYHRDHDSQDGHDRQAEDRELDQQVFYGVSSGRSLY